MFYFFKMERREERIGEISKDEEDGAVDSSLVVVVEEVGEDGPVEAFEEKLARRNIIFFSSLIFRFNSPNRVIIFKIIIMRF